jgi:heme exporter protein A
MRVSRKAHDLSHMLSVMNLSCDRGERRLFSGVGFQLSAGTCLHLQGDNGVGKTSLLRQVSGLSPLSEGEVSWCGQPIADNESFCAERIYVGHDLAMKEDLSAMENLHMDAAIGGQSVKPETVLIALKSLGLKGREHLPFRVLSQGQKRRAALARLMTRRATLWILDEPVSALDVPAQAAVAKILENHLDQGGMVLFTSHQPLPIPNKSLATYRLKG